MDSRSLWITIGFLCSSYSLVHSASWRFFHDIGLYPSVTEAQVITEMNRRSNVRTRHARPAVWVVTSSATSRCKRAAVRPCVIEKASGRR